MSPPDGLGGPDVHDLGRKDGVWRHSEANFNYCSGISSSVRTSIRLIGIADDIAGESPFEKELMKDE